MRRALLSVFFSTVLVLLFFHIANSSSWNLSLLDNVPHSFPQTSVSNFPPSTHGSHNHYYSPVAPKITVIDVFRNPSRPQLHLPNFMASVRANPEIDFLLVKYTSESEEREGKGCMPVPGLAETANAREVCLSFAEYWDMHAEWICAQWNDCAEEDIKFLTEKMKSRAKVDMYITFFRPFRAAIFSRWVDPRTLIWGMTDVDEMWGSFKRIFPWDLAPSFDVIAAASPNQWGDDILVFTPGHLVFYRNAPYVVSALMQMPNFRTMATFLQDPFLSYVSDEAEWSHYTILNTNLTFLTFPAIIRTDVHISTCDGVFGFDNVGKKQTRPYHVVEDGSGGQAMLTLGQRQEFIQAVKDQRGRRAKGQPGGGQQIQTFTNLGHEYEVTLQSGSYPEWLWFSQEFSVHYSPNYTRVPRHDVNRYVLRRAPNGPVTERVEPNPPIYVPIIPDATEGRDEWNDIRIGEALYNHFQMEKYRSYWSLPEEPLKPGEYMFMDRFTGIEIWESDGRVKFSSLLDLDVEDENAI